MSAHARLAALTAAVTLAGGLAVAPGAIAATPHNSAHTHAIAASCGHAKTVRKQQKGNATIVLRYSAKCRTAWAKETGGKAGDHLWVYNKNSKKTRKNHIKSGHTWARTASLSDKNSKSHACMQRNGGGKVCTGYY